MQSFLTPRMTLGLAVAVIATIKGAQAQRVPRVAAAEIATADVAGRAADPMTGELRFESRSPGQLA
jgi:hypothetical protein